MKCFNTLFFPQFLSSKLPHHFEFAMQDVNEIGRLFSDRRLRPPPTHHHHQPLNCPRCNSLNTKFCYYNNYNLSQPRYFCKNCRRYWTQGGVLRNVPIGGGCRKSKRSSKRPKPNPEPIEQLPIHPFNGVVTDQIGGFSNDVQQNLLRFEETETTAFQQNQLLLQHLSSVSRDWQKEKIEDDEVFAVPDWNEAHCGGGEGGEGMFDLAHGSEWSESMQWNESDDHNLYLRP